VCPKSLKSGGISFGENMSPPSFWQYLLTTLQWQNVTAVRHACRFVLQPGSVPEHYRLAAQMGSLREQCRELERSGCASAAEDFADVSLVAGDRTFRSVRTLRNTCIMRIWFTLYAWDIVYSDACFSGNQDHCSLRCAVMSLWIHDSSLTKKRFYNAGAIAAY